MFKKDELLVSQVGLRRPRENWFLLMQRIRAGKSIQLTTTEMSSEEMEKRLKRALEGIPSESGF